MSMKISVIIPIYNSEKTINYCVNSIINQTYKNLEIILINDGSTDSSLELCKNFKDDRIIIIDKPNGGVSSCRNIGIERASGDYISFIDSDDYLELNTYEKCMQIMSEKKLDILKFSFYREKINGISHKYKFNILTEHIFEKTDYENNVFTRVFIGKDCEAVWNCRFKMDVVKKVKCDEKLIVAEDFLFMIESIINSKNIMFINNAYYHYIINNNSVTLNYNYSKLLKRCCDIIFSYSKVSKMLDYDISSNVLLKEKVYKLISNKIMDIAYHENYKNFTDFINKLNNQKIVSDFIKKINYQPFKINYFQYIKLVLIGKIKRFVKQVLQR